MSASNLEKEVIYGVGVRRRRWWHVNLRPSVVKEIDMVAFFICSIVTFVFQATTRDGTDHIIEMRSLATCMVIDELVCAAKNFRLLCLVCVATCFITTTHSCWNAKAAAVIEHHAVRVRKARP
jgi:hypothetical protein